MALVLAEHDDRQRIPQGMIDLAGGDPMRHHHEQLRAIQQATRLEFVAQGGPLQRLQGRVLGEETREPDAAQARRGMADDDEDETDQDDGGGDRPPPGPALNGGPRQVSAQHRVEQQPAGHLPMGQAPTTPERHDRKEGDGGQGQTEAIPGALRPAPGAQGAPGGDDQRHEDPGQDPRHLARDIGENLADPESLG